MPEIVEFPTYETLLTEAIRSLTVDSGKVTTPAPMGTNVLQDTTKNWATNVHKNRLVKIIRGTGVGQQAIIGSNADKTLVLKQGWPVGLDTTSVYVILDIDIAQVIRETLGGGVDVDLPAEFTKLKEALRTLTEASVDTGIADATSTVNYLDDSSKNWPPSPGGFEDLIVEITEGTGEGQFAKIASNTATRITFVVAMPVAPDSTSKYRIGFFGKMTGDITDRAARLLGIVYGNVDQLQQTADKNLKASIEERLILKTIRDIAPGAVGTFWLPETGNIDLSKYLASSWGIYAPTTATMVINCYLNISHDGGTTWRRAAGYEILDADFVRDEWNTIDCPLKLAEAKLEVVIATAFPAELDLMCIAKP